MSIISCTSPSASDGVLPTSAVTSVARWTLCSVSSSPQRLTSWPRSGAGVSRQAGNASAARPIAASMSATVSRRAPTSGSPVMGLETRRVAADHGQVDAAGLEGGADVVGEGRRGGQGVGHADAFSCAARSRAMGTGVVSMGVPSAASASASEAACWAA